MTMLADDDDELMSEADVDALERAMEMARLEPGRGEQLDSKLKDEPWEDVARFAAYCCQCNNLQLQPHQSPPCWIYDLVKIINAGDDGIIGDYAAARLLQRMLNAGLSRYEPDPERALAKAKKLPPPAANGVPDQPPPTA
jgi:hypothetical protein